MYVEWYKRNFLLISDKLLSVYCEKAMQVLQLNDCKAKLSNCGKPLRALITILVQQCISETPAKVGGHSKNIKDWAIRSQGSL